MLGMAVLASDALPTWLGWTGMLWGIAFAASWRPGSQGRSTHRSTPTSTRQPSGRSPARLSLPGGAPACYGPARADRATWLRHDRGGVAASMRGYAGWTGVIGRRKDPLVASAAEVTWAAGRLRAPRSP
jgi:hypothetical protein